MVEYLMVGYARDLNDRACSIPDTMRWKRRRRPCLEALDGA
jgi:hypothetical protein